jgi:hypothetical protein
MVVRTTLPRRTPCKPRRFIKRSTVQRAMTRNALPVHLQPDLVGAIDLHVGMPDALNVRHQGVVTLRACAAQLGVALAGGVAPIA